MKNYIREIVHLLIFKKLINPVTVSSGITSLLPVVNYRRHRQGKCKKVVKSRLNSVAKTGIIQARRRRQRIG